MSFVCVKLFLLILCGRVFLPLVQGTKTRTVLFVVINTETDDNFQHRLRRRNEICVFKLQKILRTAHLTACFFKYILKKHQNLVSPTHQPLTHHLAGTPLPSGLNYGCMWEAENATVGVSLQRRLQVPAAERQALRYTVAAAKQDQ